MDPDEPPHETESGPRTQPEPDPGPPEIASGAESPLARQILGHLLQHHGELTRFEASEWTAEFGIVRAFSKEDPAVVRRTLHVLSELRLILRRSQYVVGYSDPKTVYVLTSAGRRRASEAASASTDERPS